jgi:DNA-directed RNA polymerase beta' subunit
MDHEKEISEISKIQFGVLSSKEIESMAVCEINKFKKKGDGSVYDRRLGSTEDNEVCPTCDENFVKCPGHFGVIRLNETIMNPHFIKSHIPAFLRCVCSKCYRVILTNSQVKLLGLDKYEGAQKFSLITERIRKNNVCGHSGCLGIRFDINHNPSDNNIYLKVNRNSKTATTTILLSDMDIYKIFSSLPDKDIVTLGFDPKQTHPKNFLMSNLLVLPPSCRPYVKMDGMDIADDDLTCIYSDIVKITTELINPKTVASENIKRKCIQKLKFKISTLFDNSKKKARHTSNSRPLKGIKERIAGSKESLIRGNICGKRCNQTARTVIGPNPTLSIETICVPNKIANKLTKRVTVTSFNYKELLNIINEGKAIKIVKPDGKKIVLKYALKTRPTKLLSGDIIVRGTQNLPVTTGREKLVERDQIIRDNEFLPTVKYETPREFTNLHIGDVVNRVLRDGDSLILNRQPTLHAQSMMGFLIQRTTNKNISMNLAVCRGFNADFDVKLNADFQY